MDSALDVHRLYFAFTVTYHYLFPQLTMGLALLIFILKTMALRTGDEHYNRAARASGQKFSASTLLSAWSLAFPWNSSSEPTGRNFLAPQAA
jgi:cytochrome bd-type quinol oxidase subunit 1